MKTKTIVALLFSVAGLSSAQTANTTATPAQATPLPAPTARQIVSHDANSRVWQWQTYERSPEGQVVPRTHTVKELATGMYYQDATTGQWQESKDEIDVYPQGAVARKGPYSVIFANNLNSAGAIDLQTPEGKRLRSNILGLVYHDTASGNDVLIGQVQDSTGQLIASNQVLYPNAFSGVSADVKYTYKKCSFEQDIILRSQLPTPESFGLNSATTEIEVMTEFLNPPKETIIEHRGINRSEPDQDVSWGVMRIGHGRAFDLGSEKDFRSRIPVTKQYTTVQGRKIMLEKVPLNLIRFGLQNLPRHADIKSRLLKMASKQIVLPKPLLAQTTGQPMKLASSSPSSPGYVLDYVELNTDQTDYTFQADTTYYISGACNLLGTSTFEGGTVLKYDINGELNIVGSPIVCATGPYEPAVFTSINDDTVGEPIAGSSGTPNFEDVWSFLVQDTTDNLVFRGLRFSYAVAAVFYNEYDTDTRWDFWDCQFRMNSCDILANNLYLHNVLISASTANPYDAYVDIYLQGPILEGEHVTADRGYGLVEMDAATTNFISLTNSLITGQPLINYIGNPCVLTTNCTVWLPSVTEPVYQTVGSGSYYLATNSPYRNAGTTNIDPAVLADLATKTTWPPIVYSNTAIAGGTYPPCVPRDTNSSPDLGYHYDSLDYVFSGANVATNILFPAGTAVGWFELPTSTDGLGYGLGMPDATTVTYAGTLAAPCEQVRYSTVQEGNGNWSSPVPGEVLGGVAAKGSVAQDESIASTVNARFTLFASLATETGLGGPYSSDFVCQLTHCQFNAGRIASWDGDIYLTNCLFIGTIIGAQSYSSVDCALCLQNCTVHEGSVFSGHYGGATWPMNIQNTAFENVDFSHIANDGEASDTNVTYCNYNAFLTGQELPMAGANDVIVDSFNWQPSWLGNYYLNPDSPLILAGSTTADKVGLYEFTTQTNQTEEGTAIVDIGYHYVAVDANGNPLETLTNNAPDYLVDANGDGLPDWWEQYYFGNLNLSTTNLDSSGNTLLSDYLGGLDPNIIQFSIELTNNYVNQTNITVQINLTGGTPYYYAVLVNDTDETDASWQTYAGTNINVTLGSTDGVYQVFVGLKGFPAAATQTWDTSDVAFTLDRVPAAMVITNLAAYSGSRPFIDPAGYTTKSLSSLTFYVTNSEGLASQGQGLVVDQDCNPTNMCHATNHFKCLDMALTEGTNQISILAVDWAGNVTTTNFNYVFDTNGDTTPPVIALTWPQDGMEISGNSFALRGTLDDDTAKVMAQTVDTNGVTNLVCGLVERGGRFWLENLPLSPGTNLITVTATDVAGNPSTTNLTLIQSSVTLTMDSVDASQLNQVQMNVTGEISDPSYAVWVNGVQGTNNGDGTWSASAVPVTSGGTASFDLTGYPPGYIPSGNSWTNFAIEQGAYPNPLPPDPVQASTSEDKPPVVYIQQLTWSYYNYMEWFAGYPDVDSFSESWSLGGGGSDSGSSTEVAIIGPNLSDAGTMNWPADAGYVLTLPDQYNINYDTNDVVEVNNEGYGNPHDLYFDFRPVNGAFEHIAGSGQYPTNADDWSVPPTWSETAQYVVKLFTGGKALRQSQSLFILSDGLQWSTGDDFDFGTYDTGGTVSNQDIALDALGNLAADGTLTTVQPTGENPVITPRTGKSFYFGDLPTQTGYSLVHLTQYPALTDTNPTRLNLGVGEQVNLSGMPANTVWTGPGLPPTTNSGATFFAPSNATTATVTATFGGQPMQVSFNVLEPSGLDHALIYAYNTAEFPPGVAGVDIKMTYFIAPTSVSFYRVQLLEIEEPPSSATGYFFGTTNYIQHAGWAGLGTDNHREDEVSASGLPTPWIDGSLSYEVPVLWRVGGDGTEESSMTGWDQTVNINYNGTVEIEKFGHWGQRSIDNVYSFSPGDPSGD